jgi:hypothetical protein
VRLALVSLIVLQVADAVLSNAVVARGLASEANPIVRGIVGGPAFLLVKIAGALICALALASLHRYAPRVSAACAGAAVLFYAGVLAWNSGALLIG